MAVKQSLLRFIRRVVGTQQILEILQSNGHTAPASAADPPSIVPLSRRLMNAPENEMVPCRLNRMELKLPAGLLRMYRKCLVSETDGSLQYMVESAQSDWLCERLRPGDFALDIGASGGVIAAAMAYRVGPQGKVLAFEPARRALQFLRASIAANQLPQLVAVDAVVTDQVGSIPFSEYSYDDSDPCVFRPETSAITSAMVDHSKANTYQVRATTLDEELRARNRPVRGAKIDVEGFEVHVLRGARSVIETDRPYLCIDIHASPDRSGVTTESEVRAFLAPLGYTCHMINHAMSCEPK
ncbi:MAG: FkbM family methyltransferase [Phycisphaeraceae bacterium]|nr:FkbM family methyltransferase [Phycisphaeraceae bacterium]